MFKKSLPLIIILIAVLAFIAGYALAGVKVERSNKMGYQAGWEAAKARLADSALPEMDMANLEFKQLSGEIKKIDGNQLTLKIRPLVPLADKDLDTRIITIGSDTKIHSNVMRSPEERALETKAFEKNAGSNEIIAPPSLFQEVELSANDLQVGQTISVMAGQDIKNAKEFTASEIICSPVKAQ